MWDELGRWVTCLALRNTPTRLEVGYLVKEIHHLLLNLYILKYMYILCTRYTGSRY